MMTHALVTDTRTSELLQALAGDVAPGSVHQSHLRPDRLQGQDRGLLREVKRVDVGGLRQCVRAMRIEPCLLCIGF